MSDFLKTLGVREMVIRPIGESGVIDPTIDTPAGNGVYGYQSKGYGRPEQYAPIHEAAGGFLFLPNDAPEEFVDGLVAISGLASTDYRRSNRYGVQVIDAPEGMESDLGYLRKLIIADRFALVSLYGCISEAEYDMLPEQPLDVAELVKAFMEDERKKYGTSYGAPKLEGKFGGDGYWAREELGFGFAIENTYTPVISVWSRAWLVTK